MKTIYLCMGSSVRSVLLLTLIFTWYRSNAQLDSPYTYLSNLVSADEYFYPQALNIVEPPDGSTYAQLSSLDFRQVFLQLKQSEIQDNIPVLHQLRTAMSEIAESSNAIPLAVVAMEYKDIEMQVYESEAMTWSSGFWHANGNSSEELFTTKTMFCSGLFSESARGNEQKFLLDPNCYFSNMGVPQQMEVDFDDGLGFRTFEMGVPYDVFYADLNDEKWIRIKALINGIWKYTGFTLNIRSGGDSPLQPHLPPVEWQEPGSFDSDNFPWQFSTFVEDNLVQANAYTMWSEDGILDKPFIFVEGIDFANDHTAQRNGNFGWYEFSSGESESYDFLEHMPVLLNELRANNYDIILLDFRKGDHWIEYNSMLLVKLMELVNASKVGKESIVLSGASMGGQITRYALRYMELNNINHCTRLWISLDSPHTGANIPLSLQESLKWLAQYNASAENFVHEYLLEPAARQMLSVQAFDLDIHEAYYNEIAAIGYPERVRKLAIANGNGNGIGLGYYPGQPLLQYDCDLDVTYPILRFHMYNLPGEVFVQSYPPFETGYKIAELTYSEKTSGFWNFFQEGSLTQQHVEIQNTAYLNTPNYDLAPGGTRKSVEDFVDAINEGMPDQCGQINSYLQYHSFIPTASAIGLIDVNPLINVQELLDESPELCPFDRVYLAPNNSNQKHSELTIGDGNIVFTLSEVLNGEIQIHQSLSGDTPEGNVFDYGASGDFILSDLQIFNGGELYLNGVFGYEHFDYTDTEVPYLEMHTSECGTYVNIGDQGKMIIGNENGQEVADLFIEENGEIELLSGGLLRINPNSRVIIEEGGILKLSGGELLMSGNASIEIKNGGKIIVNGNTIITPVMGVSNWIIGGEIVFNEDFTDLVFGDIEGAYTKLTFTSATEQIRGNGTNRFVVHGASQEHNLIEIAENAWLRPFWGLRELEISNCLVKVKGQLHAVCTSHFDDVTFDGVGIIRVEALNNFDDCTFSKTDTKAVFTSNLMLRMSHGEFLEGAQVFVSGGGYVLRYCSFQGGEGDPCVGSEHLTMVSNVYNSSFVEVNEGIFEESNVDLNIRGCTFSNTLIGVQKVGGRLNLRCNNFQDCQWWAVVAGQYCWLNMSSHHAAGYNHFDNNEVNIFLEDASAIDLKKGYNTLAGYHDMNIVGTLAGRYCVAGSSTVVWIDATRNAWASGFIPTQPTSDSFDIQTSNHCAVVLDTSSPEISSDCGQFDDGTISPTKSVNLKKENPKEPLSVFYRTEETGNPLINTSYFVNTSLQDALSVAASFATQWNSAGDDNMAVELFHQILLNNLDRQNTDIRWRMKWGQRYMKICLENLFANGIESAENSVIDFSPAVQKYVDVLNTMTDTVITDSTYTEQFYLEIEKAQLFRLLGMRDISLELLSKTDDCALDSLEQAHLNFWFDRLTSEMDLIDDMEDLIQDEFNYLGDSTLVEEPISYHLDEYYFGAHIFGPNDISYALCNGQNWKHSMHNPTDLILSPNPAKDRVLVSLCSYSVLYSWEILDATGRILRNGNFNGGNEILWDGLPAAMVWVRICTGNEVFVRRLCIQ
jgi:hypothetical protein